MTNAAELFPDAGTVQVRGHYEAWIYFTVEEGRTLARVRECGPNPPIEVVARTESNFGDIVVVPQHVFLAASSGRVIQIQLFPRMETVLNQFNSSRAPVLGSNGTDLVTATDAPEGLAWIRRPAGTVESIADTSYQDTPVVLAVGDEVIAQRTAANGDVQIVKHSPHAAEPQVLVEAPAPVELQLQDASEQGVLIRHRHPSEADSFMLSAVQLTGGSPIPLVSGAVLDRALWSRGAIIYFAEQDDPETSESRIHLREAGPFVGDFVVEATEGELLLEDAVSTFAEGRRLLAADADGNIYRRLILPNSP